MLLGFLAGNLVLCALYQTGVYSGKSLSLFAIGSLFYNPSVLSSNRLHIVLRLQFSYCRGQEGSPQSFKEGPGWQKGKLWYPFRKEENNPKSDSKRKLSPALGQGGDFNCSSIAAAVSLETEAAFLTVLPAKRGKNQFTVLKTLYGENSGTGSSALSYRTFCIHDKSAARLKLEVKALNMAFAGNHSYNLGEFLPFGVYSAITSSNGNQHLQETGNAQVSEWAGTVTKVHLFSPPSH